MLVGLDLCRDGINVFHLKLGGFRLKALKRGICRISFGVR
jgi:hypothetical protein